MAREAGFAVEMLAITKQYETIDRGGVITGRIERLIAIAQAEQREKDARICEAEAELGIDDERSYHGTLMAAAIRSQEK